MSVDKDTEIQNLKDNFSRVVQENMVFKNGLSSLTTAIHELFDNLSIEKTSLNEKAMDTFVSKLNQATKLARESF